LDGLHRALHELTPEDRLLARDCRDRIQSLLTYIDHHEELENNLVTFAFTQDIGAHD
jgi:Mg2+ and Co2+ transporter CorA